MKVPQQKRAGKNPVPPKVVGARPVEIPSITDFANQSFSTLTYAVEKCSIDGVKFQKKARVGGSHIHQYELKLTIHNKEYTFFLNLQPEDGKAKTYQAQQFINILKFIKEAKANPNYFKNSSSNQEELLQNFKDQLEDQESGVEEIFYSLHNLTEFLKQSDGLITGTNDLINDLSAKLTTKVEANITKLSKQQLGDYSYLLYKLDVINLKKKEGKNFELPHQLVDKIKQLFTDELKTIKEKLGSEFSADYNLVINVDENYYVLSIDEKNNALGFSRIEKGAYPVDTEFSYSADEKLCKFCSLRSILKQKTDTVSQLRQILPSDDIKTSNTITTDKAIKISNEQMVQISYIPLNPPRSIADANGKIVQYSSEFIYTDKELPFELLKSYHNTEIPLDLESKVMANIYLLKSKNNSSSKQVSIECANSQILLKKSVAKNASGEIVTTSFTTYESNSEKKLYHFIKGEVPAIFESNIKEVVGNFTVIDVVKYETMIQFKEQVQKFSLEELNFQFKMVEILNLKIDKAIKLQILNRMLDIKGMTPKNKFAIEMFKEILESSNTEIKEWNVFYIFSTSRNSYKQELINELELKYPEPDTEVEGWFIICTLMSYLGCPRQAIDYAMQMDDVSKQSAYVWYKRSLVIANESNDIIFCNYRLAALSKDEDDKLKYYNDAINVENVSQECLFTVFQCYSMLLVITEQDVDIKEILVKLEQFLLTNDKSSFMGINIKYSLLFCDVIFLSDKLKPMRIQNPAFFIKLAMHLNQDGLLGITSKLYLLKNALTNQEISQVEELSQDILNELQLNLATHEDMVKDMMSKFSEIIYKYAFANQGSSIFQHWIDIQKIISREGKIDIAMFEKAKENEMIINLTQGSEFVQKLSVLHLNVYGIESDKLKTVLYEMLNLSKSTEFVQQSVDLKARTYLLICGLYLIRVEKYKLNTIKVFLTKAEELNGISMRLKAVITFIRLRLSINDNKFEEVEKIQKEINSQHLNELRGKVRWIYFINLGKLTKLDFYRSMTCKLRNKQELINKEVGEIKNSFFERELTFKDFNMLMLLASRDAINEKKYIKAILKFAIQIYQDEKLKFNIVHKFLLYEFVLWSENQGSTLKNLFIKCYTEQKISDLPLKEFLEKIKIYALSGFSAEGYDLIRIGILVI